MHRTGMVIGVIRRFLNPGDTLEAILADYRRHVDYRDDANPGGREALNERFIAEFDLTLLRKPDAAAAEGAGVDAAGAGAGAVAEAEAAGGAADEFDEYGFKARKPDYVAVLERCGAAKEEAA